MVNILTGIPFNTPKRLNHREDEVALEFPSSAGSRARGLLALKAMNWRASGHAPVQSGLYYSYDVVAGSSVQSLGLTVNGAAQIDWGDGTSDTLELSISHDSNNNPIIKHWLNGEPNPNNVFKIVK